MNTIEGFDGAYGNISKKIQNLNNKEISILKKYDSELSKAISEYSIAKKNLNETTMTYLKKPVTETNYQIFGATDPDNNKASWKGCYKDISQFFDYQSDMTDFLQNKSSKSIADSCHKRAANLGRTGFYTTTDGGKYKCFVAKSSKKDTNFGGTTKTSERLGSSIFSYQYTDIGSNDQAVGILNNGQLAIANAPPTDNINFSQYNSIEHHPRYVRLDNRTGKPQYLNIYEVQIFSGGKNIAIGKPTGQSSNLYGSRFGGQSRNGTFMVDNVIGEEGMFSTKNSTKEWGVIDLTKETPIDYIKVYNREVKSYPEWSERILDFKLTLLDGNKNEIFSYNFTNTKSVYTIEGVFSTISPNKNVHIFNDTPKIDNCNVSYGAGINLNAATYGGNVTSSGVFYNNWGSEVKKEVQYKKYSPYTVQIPDGKDPAYGKSKDFLATYNCFPGQKLKQVYINPEAHLKNVIFDCSDEYNKCTNTKLTITDDGNLTLTQNNKVVWKSNTNTTGIANDTYNARNSKYKRNYIKSGEFLKPGEFIGSPSGTCYFTLNKNNNTYSAVINILTLGCSNHNSNTFSYNVLSNTDSLSNDFNSKSPLTVEEAKQICDNDNKCLGFTYETSSKKAWFKYKIRPNSELTTNKLVDLYIKKQSSTNGAITGNYGLIGNNGSSALYVLNNGWVDDDNSGKVFYVNKNDMLQEYPSSMLKFTNNKYNKIKHTMNTSNSNIIYTKNNISLEEAKSICNNDDKCYAIDYNNVERKATFLNSKFIKEITTIDSNTNSIYIKINDVNPNNSCNTNVSVIPFEEINSFKKTSDMTPNTECGLSSETTNERKVLEQKEQNLINLITKIKSYLDTLMSKKSKLSESIQKEAKKMNNTIKQYENTIQNIKQNKNKITSMYGKDEDSELSMLSSNYNYLLWTTIASIAVVGGIKVIRSL